MARTKRGIPYFSGEDYEYAGERIDQWFNPRRGLVEFYEDPTYGNFLKLTAIPAGYATVAYALGAEGFFSQHLYLIASEAGLLNPYTAVFASAIVQHQIGSAVSELPGHSNVNARTNVTNIWFQTGGMSGGVMPSVPNDGSIEYTSNSWSQNVWNTLFLSW